MARTEQDLVSPLDGGGGGPVVDQPARDRLTILENAVDFENPWDNAIIYAPGTPNGATVFHNGLKWTSEVPTIAGEEPGVSPKWEIVGLEASYQVSGITNDTVTNAAINSFANITVDIPAFDGYFLSKSIVNFGAQVNFALPTTIPLAIGDSRLYYWGIDSTGTVVQLLDAANDSNTITMFNGVLFNNGGTLEFSAGISLTQQWQFAQTSRTERNDFVNNNFTFDPVVYDGDVGFRTITQTNIAIRDEGINPSDLGTRNVTVFPAGNVGLFLTFFHTAPAIVVAQTTGLPDPFQWENAGTPTGMTNNRWYYTDIFLSDTGISIWRHPLVEYTDEASALNAAENDPVTPILIPNNVKFAGRFVLRGQLGNGAEDFTASNHHFVSRETRSVSSVPIIDNDLSTDPLAAWSANRGRQIRTDLEAHGIDSVLAIGEPLTTDRVITLDGHGLFVTGDGALDVDVTLGLTHTLLNVNGTLASIGANDAVNTSIVDVRPGIIELDNTAGVYSITTTPSLNSDLTTGELVMRDTVNGNITLSSLAAFRSLSSGANPADGITTAWYIGQQHINTATGDTFVATAKSTDPDAAATGSVWSGITAADTHLFTVGGLTNTANVVHTDDFGWAITGTGDKTLINTNGSGNSRVFTAVSSAFIDANDGVNSSFIASDRDGRVRLNSSGGNYALVQAPLLNSDLITNQILVRDTASNELRVVNNRRYETLTDTTAPVDGTTAAFYVGQQYINTTTGKTFLATTKSTDPDSAGTGSIWTQLEPQVISIAASQAISAAFNDTIIYANDASDITLTIDDVLPTGGSITVIQKGAGQIIFTAGGGVTINSLAGADRTVAQWAAATITKEGTGQYTLIGTIT